MRAVIQRVTEARVDIKGSTKGQIKRGLVVFIGIEDTDNQDDIEWLVKKMVQLRIFQDNAGQMNKSILNVDGNILLISQFTLLAQTRKGNRPSFLRAAKPSFAIPTYQRLCKRLSASLGKEIETGVFGANMQVSLVNDGPVTFWLDSKNKE